MKPLSWGEKAERAIVVRHARGHGHGRDHDDARRNHLR
jgi:hypothetical protein